MKSVRFTARYFALAAMSWALAAGPAARGGESSVAAAQGTTILNNGCYLRSYLVYRTPVFITKGGDIKVPLDPAGQKPLADYQSPPPPEGWFKPDFDDSVWDRQNAPVEATQGYATGHSHAARYTAPPNSIICLRWKFMVEDPARAPDLKLAIEYVGGAAVYVNGQELLRGHLPAGELKIDTQAEKYPDDLHCLPDGSYLQSWRIKDNQAAFDLRYRKLADVAVPEKMLVKGANLLAVEIRRAPINEAAIAAKRVSSPGDGMSSVEGMWAYAGLRSIRLTSAGAGAVPSTGRPRGVQVWNAAVFSTVTAFDYGDPGEPMPVRVAAAKNSVFSGRLVVSSDAAIKGFKAAVSELREAKGGGSLPASTVKVRYAEPAVPAKSWSAPQRFDGLLDAIPAEIPVTTQKGANAGAVASLWFTARVPKDAKAGKYEGTITVEAEGLKARAVPFILTVHDWTMPDPRDFRQKHLIFLSQEAVARHYGVPLWSDRHMELMGRSMDLLAEVNSRETPMNLAIDFYGLSGNSESMVRWVRPADPSAGSGQAAYKYDFTVFDKYCDLAEKKLGKPFPLRLNCWDEVAVKDGKLGYKYGGSGMGVTVVDAATGKLGTIEQPLPGTEESFKFWKPVIDEALGKLKARGWLDVTAFGHNSACYAPNPQVVDVARKLWPEGAWAYTAHNGSLGGAFKGSAAGNAMPMKYAVSLWGEAKPQLRGASALSGPRGAMWVMTGRSRHKDWSPLVVVRNLPEEALLKTYDGVGDFGADLFPVRKEKGNGFYCVGQGRGTDGPGAAQIAILAPGPDGAVATERFENFREGTEFGEAVIYLERALAEKKIGGELAQKVTRHLDERGRTFLEFWLARRGGRADSEERSVPGQADRDARLLELCAEVAGGK